MSKITTLAAGLAVVPMLAFAAPVFADSPGQLMGGSALYEVKNLTTSSSYGASATATCNDEVQYSVEVHNTEFGTLSNINLKASLANTGSNLTASATTSAGNTVSVNGSVATTLGANQNIAYEAGSTTLYDGSGKLVKTLSDGITTSGLNIGSLAGSTGEYVNFKAKVNCTVTPPTPTQIQVCNLSTKQIVTINESDFNSSLYTKDLTQCAVPTTPPTTPTTPVTPTTPTVLPNTGAGDVIGIIAGVVVAGTVASRLYLSRKLARKA